MRTPLTTSRTLHTNAVKGGSGGPAYSTAVVSDATVEFQPAARPAASSHANVSVIES